jgi:mercuric ion binding protein
MKRLAALAALGFGLGASPPAFAADKTVTLAVQHMTCAACPGTVKASFQKVPGVTNVVVSAEDKTVVVTYDDSVARVAMPTNWAIPLRRRAEAASALPDRCCWHYCGG